MIAATDREYDVLIVGAGPAGLFAAARLDASLKVLIVERQAFPPTKPCGDLLMDEGYAALAPLDPPESIFDVPGRVPIRVIDRNRGLPPAATGSGRILDRPALSRWLRELSSGRTDLQERTRFVGWEEAGRRGESGIAALQDADGRISRVRAGCLIGADGFMSAVRRKLFGRTVPFLNAVQYRARAAHPPDGADFVFDRKLAPGFYLWAFPRSDGRILIGCPYAGGNFRRAAAWARERYGADAPDGPMERHPITRIVSEENIILGRGGVLLAGEAAGFVRPRSGEGLSTAFLSADAAAQAVAFDPLSPEDEYRRLCAPLLEDLLRDLSLPPA